jgi:hypothetical protein
MLRLRIENFHLRATHGGNSGMGIDQKRDGDAQVFLHGRHNPQFATAF